MCTALRDRLPLFRRREAAKELAHLEDPHKASLSVTIDDSDAAEDPRALAPKRQIRRACGRDQSLEENEASYLGALVCWHHAATLLVADGVLPIDDGRLRAEDVNALFVTLSLASGLREEKHPTLQARQPDRARTTLEGIQDFATRRIAHLDLLPRSRSLCHKDSLVRLIECQGHRRLRLDQSRWGDQVRIVVKVTGIHGPRP